ncbi:MAG: acetyl-CoA hydrolase/transferase C-terminal domain-containing protein [Gammaproteobacteria bacterium]
MTKKRDWQSDYEQRLLEPEAAMDLIEAGDWVNVNVGTPAAITVLLNARAEALGSLDMRMLGPGLEPLLTSDRDAGEREIEIFIGEPARPSHDTQRATYLPNTFMLGMKAFDSGREEARMPDVNIVVCSAPNEAGYVHFGPTHWMRKAYLKRCRKTIAFVDPNLMPVHGDVWAHVNEFTAFVEGVTAPAVDVEAVRTRIIDEAPPENRDRLLSITNVIVRDRLAPIQDTIAQMDPAVLEKALNLVIDPSAQKIADYLRTLIRDGDTIQVGIGQPSSLMFEAGAFDDAKHLGLHTELGSPGLARLWARGILDNSRKSIHRGKAVAVAWSGCDADDLDIIRDNPAFELYDPSYLLNPALIAQNHQMTSINSAIAVDLIGQVASEDRYGGMMVNGTGGQPDNHMGAALCPTGRAIIVLRATALGGAVSKIVPKHEAGTLITIPRYLADTVITEFGIARLMDKNHRQRAEELIRIAHPDFREELTKEAKALWG